MNHPYPPSVTVAADVPLVPWPEQEETRRLLHSLGLPRLLLVAPGVEPPPRLDDLEDWVREPAEAVDLLARMTALAHWAQEKQAIVPVLDDDGLLWMGGRWVAITNQQLPVVEVLLASLGRVVRMEAIVAAYVAGGGSDHPPSVRTLIARLSTRVRSVGLELSTVRRRGVVLSAGVIPRVPQH